MSKSFLSDWSDEEWNESSRFTLRKRLRGSEEISDYQQLSANASKTGSNLLKFVSTQVSSVSSSLNCIMSSGYKTSKSKSNNNNNQFNNLMRNESHCSPRGMNNISFNTNGDTDMTQITRSANNMNAIQINPYVLLQTMPPQLCYSNKIIHIIPTNITQTINTTSNSISVLCQNDNKSNVDNYKCKICGQIGSSPHRCNHCGRRFQKSMTSNRVPAIPTDLFFGPSRPSPPTIFSANIWPRVGLSQSGSKPIRSLKPECITIDDMEKRQQLRENDEIDVQCVKYNDRDNEDFTDTAIQCNLKNNSIDRNDCQQIEDSKMNPDLNSGKDEPKIPNSEPTTFASRLRYVMFGTYRCEPKALKFDSDGIKLTNVSPNNIETKFRYHISMPFVEMTELKYCNDNTIPSIFIKPMFESNCKIQDSLYLGNKSKNGLKFDINSSDEREHYMIAIMYENISNGFMESLKSFATKNNPNINISEYGVDKAKLIITTAQNSRMISKTNSSKIFDQLMPKCLSMNVRKNVSPYSGKYCTTPPKMKEETPTKPIFSNKRNHLRSPRSSFIFHTPVETIQIDDDDNSTDMKNECDDDLNRVILIFPVNEKNAMQLSGNDILCLNKGEFLNDNIVNFYLRRLSSCFGSISNDVMEKTHIFDTKFFMQLTERQPAKRKTNEEPIFQYSFEICYHMKLKNWTKNVDIFSKDFLIMPIIKESHWFLAIVCYANNVSEYSTQSKEPDKRPCILFMDSLGNASLRKQMSTPIREFLSYEWKEKKDSDVQFKSRMLMRDHFPRVPKHTNSSECGLFVLEYVEQFLKDPNYVLNKINANLKSTNFKKWFSINEAKDKRQIIRAIIFSLIKPEIANKLKKFVKDDIGSDDEDVNDEIGEIFDETMDCDVVSKRKVVNIECCDSDDEIEEIFDESMDSDIASKLDFIVDLECSDKPVTRSANKSIKSVQSKDAIDKIEEYLLTTSEANPVVSQDNSDLEIKNKELIKKRKVINELKDLKDSFQTNLIRISSHISHLERCSFNDYDDKDWRKLTGIAKTLSYDYKKFCQDFDESEKFLMNLS